MVHFIIIFVLASADLVIAGSKIPTAVLELNEKFLDVMNEGMWFVEAYAPWCGHCKRLAPTWEHVGHALADRNSKVHVGKIDCTRYPSVASALKVHGYPTLIFFRNGVQIPYEGERKKETMVDFALKSAGPVIGQLTSTPTFHEMRKASSKDPFFIFFSNELEEEKQKSDLFLKFKASSEQLFTEVKFVMARFSSNFIPFAEKEGVSERVAVIKDDTHFYYDPTQGQSLGDWIQAERWTLMPIVSSANIHSISKSTQKKMVLMLSESSEIVENIDKTGKSGKFLSVFKKAAELSRDDATLKSNFQFGLLDDNTIANNVVMGLVKTPNLLVFNLSSYEFYVSEDAPDRMTEQSIATFLKNVASGNVTVQGGRSWPTRIRRMIYDITSNVYDMFYHQPILTTCLFGVPLAFLSIIGYSVCSTDFSVEREEIYSDEEEEEELSQGEQEYTDRGEESEVELPPNEPIDSSHQKAE